MRTSPCAPASGGRKDKGVTVKQIPLFAQRHTGHGRVGYGQYLIQFHLVAFAQGFVGVVNADPADGFAPQQGQTGQKSAAHVSQTYHVQAQAGGFGLKCAPQHIVPVCKGRVDRHRTVGRHELGQCPRGGGAGQQQIRIFRLRHLRKRANGKDAAAAGRVTLQQKHQRSKGSCHGSGAFGKPASHGTQAEIFIGVKIHDRGSLFIRQRSCRIGLGKSLRLLGIETAEALQIVAYIVRGCCVGVVAGITSTIGNSGINKGFGQTADGQSSAEALLMARFHGL